MTTLERAALWLLVALYASGSLYIIVSLALYEPPAPRKRVAFEHLPSVCQKYMNDGTDNWINCMGVGKK